MMSMYPLEMSVCKIVLKHLEYGEKSSVKKKQKHFASWVTVHYTVF